MAVLHALAVALVVSTLGMLWMKRITSAIRTLALQSLLLGMIALWMANRTGITELYIMAGLTIAVKAVVIPAILYTTMRRIGIARETEKWVGREFSVLAGAGLLLVGYYVTKRVHFHSQNLEHAYLAISIAMLFIGLFIMMTHKKAMMQGVGLIVMENGLYLVALTTMQGMPFLVDIGMFLDIFVAVILISLLTYRIDRTYHSMHTDYLRKLKG